MANRLKYPPNLPLVGVLKSFMDGQVTPVVSVFGDLEIKEEIMMDNKVTWDFSKGTLTTQEINYVENQLEVKFPQDYIEVVSKHNGGFPEPDTFTMNTWEEMMNNLINLKADADHNIFKMIDAVSDRLVSGLIPFGRDAGGNLICFDYRTSEMPTIVFWDHEIAGGGELEKAVTFICDNFTEFLNMLHESIDD